MDVGGIECLEFILEGIRGIEREDGYFIKEGHLSYNGHFDGKMDPLRVENTY